MSWLTTTPLPGKFIKELSNAITVSKSKSLVGSSSINKLAPNPSSTIIVSLSSSNLITFNKDLAKWTLHLSPPDKVPTNFCCSDPLKLKVLQY